MLEPPNVPDAALIAHLRDVWRLRVTELAFLPLGADVNTAVYRAVADDATPYFAKLRRGAFDEASVVIPRLLADQGNTHIIAPLATADGRLWTRLGDFAVLLSPFVTGRDGSEVALTDRQLVELGQLLRDLHALSVPPDILHQIPRETYSPRFREQVRLFQAQAEQATPDEPVAVAVTAVTALLREQRETITALIERAEQLAARLRSRALQFVLCHADIHAFNVLIGADDRLYVVDWDTLIVAPKERDLMFIGAGIGDAWTSAREAALFYAGYGATEVDPTALAYYRYERIVQDIAAFGEQLLLTDEGGADREQSLRYLASNFLPGALIDIARQADSAR